MRTPITNSSSATLALLVMAVSAFPLGWVWSGNFSEPATVFYGKVLGTGSARDFLITSGSLSWTILRADGSEVTFNTTLFPLANGTLSYRLDVPHAAFALGLTSDSDAVPLPPVPEVNRHKQILVDGEAATLLGPAGSAFTTEQLLRTSTYRLDLAIGRAALDSDGDGIPDGWEDLYGLDKQDPSDALGDPNGDGLTARDAYLRGLDPRRDARAPAILTTEIVVYRDGTTGVLLDAADLNSTPDQLVYTVMALPKAGSMLLRNSRQNPAGPDAPLAVGDVFTQADLLGARVLYRHDGSGADPGSFSVELRDENPENPVASAAISLLTFTPGGAVPADISANEEQRLANAVYCENDYVVLDGRALTAPTTLHAPSSGLTGSDFIAYVAAYGDDRRHVILGGTGDPALTGGAASDVLIPGPGNATLTGGLGADLFTFYHFAHGNVVIEDFEPDEDVIDLSRLPAPAGSYVNSYVRLAPSAEGMELRIDLDGDGVGFTNLIVSLPGLASAETDLYAWVGDGHLRVGDLALQPQITVAVREAQASENGPAEGVFTLFRAGSLAGDLTVNIAMGGSAQNGTDYALIPATIVLPSGAAAVDVKIKPYADSVAEASETVSLNVLPGSGYRVGAANSKELTIADRLMLIEIEALDPVAVKDSATPGYFLVRRWDVYDRDVLIRLAIGGTAANGADYNRIETFVLMGVNQTVALIPIEPKSTANLAGGMETVQISISSDAAYRVMTSAGQAQVAIVERMDTFAAWRSRAFPGSVGTLDEFALADSGGTGISHLQRYAYGLDPQKPDREGLPKPFLMGRKFTVSFRKPLGVTDIQYHVSAATELWNWAGSQVELVQVPAPAGATDPQRVYYQLAPSVGEAPIGFISIRLERMP